MNSIEMKGVNSNLSQVVLEDVQYLKQHLDGIVASSDQTLIKNLIEETEFLLAQAKDDLKTYEEKYNVFKQLTESLFNVGSYYNNNPEATELIFLIDHLTNYTTAYSHLCLSLSLINEGKTGEYERDLKRVVSGFLLLCEIVDVFIEFFSTSELEQISSGAKNAILTSNRNVEEYFIKGFKLSNLVTQLRAYSSLIMLKIQEHTHNTPLTLKAEAKRLGEKMDSNLSDKPWWEQIAGTFANNLVYDEAMRLGQEYRNSLNSDSTELSDI